MSKLDEAVNRLAHPARTAGNVIQRAVVDRPDIRAVLDALAKYRRVAEAVIDRLRAGESVASVADDYAVHEAYILAVLLALERGGLIDPKRTQR